jgi:hypothetical protein
VLSRAHSTPVGERESLPLKGTRNAADESAVPNVLRAAQEPMESLIDTVSKLAQAASKMPYYKFNNMWSRQMQGAVRSSSTRL